MALKEIAKERKKKTKITVIVPSRQRIVGRILASRNLKGYFKRSKIIAAN